MLPPPSRSDATDFDLESWLARAPDPPPIVQIGTPVLRQRARAVPAAWFGSPALQRLVELMIEAMRRAPGVGLAAPQIGVPLRVFVAEDPEELLARVPSEVRGSRERVVLPLQVLLNPTLGPTSDELALFFEGCLSVRGYGALVPRFRSVKVTGFDLHGRPAALELSGWPARILQHEMDHLNGTLYVDRMISRSFAEQSELARLGAMAVGDVLAEIGEPAPE